MRYLTPFLWLYSILREADASALPSSTSTAKQVAANKVPLAVGLTLGLLTLVALVLGAFCLLRRRRRMFVGRYAHAASLRRIPSTPQVNQPSSWPQDRKRPRQATPSHNRQSTPSSTLRSTLSGTIATGADDSTTPFGTAGLGLPPSYESHLMTSRVGEAE